MVDYDQFKPPEGFDWQHWISRWDRMQERYLVHRDERIDTILYLVRKTQDDIRTVVDIGCGTGSLMQPLLEAFPEAQVYGVDFDPALVILAGARLESFGDRARLIRADLRDPDWTKAVEGPVDAVVSATALHWLSPETLANLYGMIAGMLHPGGIFLNADHVASESEAVQRAWVAHREEMLSRQQSVCDNWTGFWEAYGEALGVDLRSFHEGIWDFSGSVEDGLPLTRHFEMLNRCGFSHVECFWRCDCDAIYGGLRG